MTQFDSLAFIPDDELFATVQRLTARSNVALADLLAHLGEVERRGIHRERACASLYTYCIYELRMSEDAAFRRSKAARFVREYPELRTAIAKGEIHLTGVLMIGPHLGGERHAEVLRRARFRSKRELARLIAEIDPKPEVPALVEAIGPPPLSAPTHRAFVETLSGPVRELLPGRRPEDWTDENDDATLSDDTPAAPPDMTESQRALRYKVQFTATQEFVDLLDEARDLLGYENPRPALPDIQLRALRSLVKGLRAQKRAATERPRAQQGASGCDVESATATATAPEGDSSFASDAAPARETCCSTPRRSGRSPLVTSQRRYVARYSTAMVRAVRTATIEASDAARHSVSKSITVAPTRSAAPRRSTISSSDAARTTHSLPRKTSDGRIWVACGA
jgi:hypothetical protein